MVIVTRDWARYWRSPDRPVEAMHAHFQRHVYHRHSHDTYSFGVTESGAQSFTCRGAAHTSAAGMVMAFNPDDPHDGHATDALGFTYRIVHLAPELLTGVLSDAADRPVGRPLFRDPVIADRKLAGALRNLHASLWNQESALARDEALSRTLTALSHQVARFPTSEVSPSDIHRIAARARERLEAAHLEELGADELAAAVGRSRFVVYRAFREAYGMAPSDFQRQLRLRAARRLLRAGRPVAEAAALAGFADQSHLTRWFGRYFGITPAQYRRAVQ
jgi:AraC-like DNA-binding protein